MKSCNASLLSNCFVFFEWNDQLSVGIFCLRIPLFVYRVLEELCWCHVLPSYALFVFLKSILFSGETCKNVQRIQYSKNIQRKLRRLSGLIWRRELIWFRVASKHPPGILLFIFFLHIQQLNYHHSEFENVEGKKVYINLEKVFFLDGNLNFSQYVKRGCNGSGWMADWSTRPINESGLLHKFTLAITTNTQQQSQQIQ